MNKETENTAIAIFVKTPALSPVKTRLATGIGNEEAQEFYRLSVETIKEIVKFEEADPYWAVAEEKGLTDPLWLGFPPLHTGDGGLGERQHYIYEYLLTNYDRVLLIGADAPQISKDILKQAITALDTHDFVIGPARDGGYYLFGGRTKTPQKMWASVPWSTSDTREKLEALLPSKPVHLTMLTDVDTQDDLQYVRQEMPEHITPEQNRILEWIENYEHPVSLHGQFRPVDHRRGHI